MVYLNLRGKALLTVLTFACGLGQFLHGYDNGVLGGLLTAPSFIDQFHLGASLQGTVTALFQAGCAIGCFSTSLLSHRFGRLPLTHIGTAFICAGAALQASSSVVAQLIVGRIVAGIGLGIITSATSVLQSETAPRRIRGRLLATSLSSLIVGQVLANWLDYGMNTYTTDISWRFPLAFQGVIAFLMSLLLFFMPESPRWLLQHERDAEATSVLMCLLDKEASDQAVLDEIADIKRAIAIESNSKGWRDLIKPDVLRSRYRVGLSCLVMGMQPFSGSTVLSYYTAVIFQVSIGMTRHMALLMAGFLQLWFLFASFGTWFFIERVGRRRMFMASACGMSIVMAILAAMLSVGSYTTSIVAAAMLFLYQTFYTWGWMAGVWTYGPEILPLEHRAKGTGLASTCLYGLTFMILEVVPVSIANISWRTFILFAVFNAFFVPIVYFLFPETAGLSLEGIDLVFMDRSGSPVKNAMLRKNPGGVNLQKATSTQVQSSVDKNEFIAV